MERFVVKRVLCGGLALAVLAALTALSAADDKEPSVKDIMTKAHKGGDSLLEKLGPELKADEPKWDDIQKQTKELADLGASLQKAKPPRGEQESWDKLTKAYADNAKALDAAAQKKEQKAAQDDYMKLKTSCMTCHRAHKPFKPKP
jgi:hypothetical protein